MPESPDLAIDMRNITKRFPGVLAVDNVDFSVKRGEIHALLGENGAGKSTLMQVLSGRLVPEEGSVRLLGDILPPGSPKAAIQAGLGMVYQHFKLVPSLTVAENLLLGRDRGSVGLRLKDISRRIVELGERFKLLVDPKAEVWKLSMAERQRAEILRLLVFDAQVLVFDEPTTILTPQETDELLAALKRMRKEGRSVVFISHKLEEVLSLADRITVLNHGRRLDTIERENTDKTSLAELMLAGDWEPAQKPRLKDPMEQKATFLKLEGVSVLDDMGIMRIKNLDLELKAGEILGVAGVAGNGQRELAEVCSGVRRPAGGRVTMEGRELTDCGPYDFINSGVGFVPEDRHEAGCVGILSLTENLLLKDYRDPKFCSGPWVDWTKAKGHAEKMIGEYDIRPPDCTAKAGQLSGGNLQKLLLARELDREPKVIIAAYPLRGLDIASASFIQNLLVKHAEAGGAVLFISEDLQSILEVSHRLVVIFRGSIMGSFENQGLDHSQLGLLMAGEESK